ncbi:MAG: PQQ-dependent sugar dehydrogenase [Planctomycetes bacterium]|nr:PQQ-dependent sugar dehydrogenase [Planctomycetota bacterium]
MFGQQRRSCAVIVLLALTISFANRLYAGTSGLALEYVVTAERPVFVTHAPGDFERIFVVEQAGMISIIVDGVLLETPFLDISNLVYSAGIYPGLLGMAFDPEYETNGFFYVVYHDLPNIDIAVMRYQVSVDPEIADPKSATPIILIPIGATNECACIGFSPLDGYLYVATADGGVVSNGQDLNSLLGKILRLDVTGDDFPADSQRNYAIPPSNPFVGIDGNDEIWAYGFRKPWRLSFDRETGDIYIGEVGSDYWEEVNFQPASSTGGENYGYGCKEAFQCLNLTGCDCKDPTFVDPIFAYENPAFFGAAVIGGYVYRGCAISSLVGSYVVADVRTQLVWTFRYDGKQLTDLQEVHSDLDPGGGFTLSPPLASFGEDAFGELYMCEVSSGEIFKIIPAVGTYLDCNDNGISDACDIDAGTSEDVNNDGIPDECGCAGDVDTSGSVDIGDLINLLGCYGYPADECSYPLADIYNDGYINAIDLTYLLGNWGLCP